jgi:hypothetical protein
MFVQRPYHRYSFEIAEMMNLAAIMPPPHADRDHDARPF